MSEFSGISNDKDTITVARFEAKLDDIDTLYEKWVWGEIQGESFIFHADDVCHLDDAGLIAFAKESPMVKPDSKITISRKNEFIYLNFNFQLNE